MRLKRDYEMTFKEGLRLGMRLTRAKAYIENARDAKRMGDEEMAELYFDQEKCEARRIVMENSIVDMALEQGINPIYTQTWCLESSMFVINNS